MGCTTPPGQLEGGYKWWTLWQMVNICKHMGRFQDLRTASDVCYRGPRRSGLLNPEVSYSSTGICQIYSVVNLGLVRHFPALRKVTDTMRTRTSPLHRPVAYWIQMSHGWHPTSCDLDILVFLGIRRRISEVSRWNFESIELENGTSWSRNKHWMRFCFASFLQGRRPKTVCLVLNLMALGRLLWMFI